MPGSIRGDFSLQYHNSGRNVIHASDSTAEAQREIALWFKTEEIVDWNPSYHLYLYDMPAENEQHTEKDMLIEKLKSTPNCEQNGHLIIH